MWFAGFVFGALLGASLGWSGAWLFFGALGAIAGFVYSHKDRAMQAQAGTEALERRVAELERQMRALQLARGDRASAIEPAPAAPAEPPVEAPSVAPEAPVSPPILEVPAAASVVTEAIAEPIASPEPKPPQPAPEAPAEPSWLWQKLVGGNILAKIGVLLLFFGIASGMKLAIDYGLFPPSVRLLIGTVAGIAMIAFGFSRMPEPRHRMFGLALQGGGFGVLYLVTYFALAWYRYIDPVTAFAIFAVLGVACLGAAVSFEGEPLAILGIAGAFAAPLLASTERGNHVVLFSYYAVLDALVLSVYWLRLWRVLTVIAFAFTLVVGMSWALARYTPDEYTSTQAFLVLFSVLFSLAPFASAMAQRSTDHWGDTALMFGTPIAAAAAQNWLISRTGYGDIALAWSAVGAGIYYSALAAMLHEQATHERERFAHGAIAVAFYTIAVPLAFGVQVTSALWALEGLALAWYGLGNRRPLAYAAGVGLQLVAGAYFFVSWQEPRVLPVLNGAYFGCAIIAACGAVTATMTRRQNGEPLLDKDLTGTFSDLIGAWALAWWLGANFSEIHHFAPARHEMALYISIAVLTAWALSSIGQAKAWLEARHAAVLLTVVALIAGVAEGWLGARERHALHDTLIFAMPAAFVTLYALLRLHERDGLLAGLRELHVVALLILAVTLLREALWIAGELAPHVTLWRVISWQIMPAAIVWGLIYLERHDAWPVTTQRAAYLAAGAPIMLVMASLAAIYANFAHAGGGSGVPYMPVASFFDVAQIAVIAVIVAWSRTSASYIRSDLLPLAKSTAPALGFLWLSAMAMRIAHHWGHVPFEAHALIASGMAQSMLSLLWTALALGLMISATRKVRRERWFIGFGLLGIVGAKFILVDVVNKGTITWTLSLIGVGLLILAASYFSPAPPRAAKEAEVAT